VRRLVGGIERQPAARVRDRRIVFALCAVGAHQSLQRARYFPAQALGLKELPFVEARTVAQSKSAQEVPAVEAHRLGQRGQAVGACLGFRVAEGPEVEDDWHNFQALNIPPDHPARTMKDSLYVNVPGRPELLLRTETSAVQIRTMQAQPPPVFVVAPGRVYRRETPDPTHLPVFHQIEGLAVDDGITFADLKGTLEVFAKAMFGERRRIRLGPAFFPFVEPGCEVGVSCFRCEGDGCRVCGTGWIELLGAGMVHPVVLENCGYDPERYTGFAFGLGIERVALLRYEIPDIRMLVDGDVRLLEQFQGVA